MLLFPVAPSYADVFSFAEANPWLVNSLPLAASFFEHVLAEQFPPLMPQGCFGEMPCCERTPAADGDQFFSEGAAAGDDVQPKTPASERGEQCSTTAVSSAAGGEDESAPSEFSRTFDLAGFVPEEITVKTVGNFVEIHAGHLEKPSEGVEQDYVRREYTRRFALPEDVSPESVSSVWNKDGTLVVRAVKTAKDAAVKATV